MEKINKKNKENKEKYKVGMKVVHPLYGAGRIERIEKKKILMEEKRCYVVKFLLTNLELSIPVNTIENAKLRKVVDKQVTEKIIEELMNNKKGEVTKVNWRSRYSSYMDDIRTGSIYKTIEVIKSILHCRNKNKGLTTVEKHLLENACKIVASEIAIVKDVPLNNILSLLKNIL